MFFINFARKLATMKKNTYIKGFFAVVAVLALIRIIWPEVAGDIRDERTPNGIDSLQTPQTVYVIRDIKS